MSKEATPTAARRLTPKERRFVYYAIAEGHNSKARLLAGYRDYGRADRNSQEAWRLTQKPHICAALQSEQSRQIQDLGVSVERMFTELCAVGLSDLGDCFSAEGQLLPIDEIPPHARKAIAEYTVEVLSDKDGETVQRRRVKLHPKTPALMRMLGAFMEQLGRHLPRPDGGELGGDAKRLPRAELERIASGS